MKPEKKPTPSTYLLLLTLVLGISAFFLPFIVTRIPSLNNYVPNNSNLADNLNGFVSPVLYLLTSILLFLSFREQNIANRYVRKQLEESKKTEVRRIFVEEILNYEKYLDKIGERYAKFGGNILQTLFCDYINGVNHKGEDVLYKKNPELHFKEKHVNLYFAVNSFESLYNDLERIDDIEIKTELRKKLEVLFEFYFHGALTIGYFKSKFAKESPDDYIQKIHAKLISWRSELMSDKFTLTGVPKIKSEQNFQVLR